MTTATQIVRLKVNGRHIEHQAQISTTLREFLHDAVGCQDVKFGCGEGVCGACTVLIDGEPRATCIQLAVQADGCEVVTASGLAEHAPPAIRAKAQLLIDHLVAREAFQCGYCAPGMLVAAAHAIAAGEALSADDVRQELSGNICRCSGYRQIVESVVAASAGEPPPATELARPDIHDKILGRIRYPSDVVPNGESPLVGKILWSEHPHAEIRAIDTRAAQAIPGVVAVLTWRDVPGKNVSGTTVFGSDQPILASDRVLSIGDPVALVAATSRDAADNALQAIQVSYSPLPTVATVQEALADGAPQLHPHGNVIAQFTKVEGDIEAGLRAPDVTIVEGDYEARISDHACMELEGSIGWMDSGNLVVCATTLTPHEVRKSIARGLGLSENQIRIEAPAMGGSFGKYLTPAMEAQLALLVYKTRRPVRLFLDRDEILARRPKRHGFWGHYRLALKPDGSFVALDADVIADAGAYISLTPPVVSVFADEANGAYEFPNLRVRARGVLTNNPPGSPMRGFGSQQITFGIESIVEKAARTLRLDPAEIRQKNFIRTRMDSHANESPDPDSALPKTVDVVKAHLNGRPEAPPGWIAGRGIASIRAKYGYPYGISDRFAARITIDSEGRFLVEADIPDSGTGVTTAMPRFVAQMFQLDQQPEYRVSQAMLDDPSGYLVSHGRWAAGSRQWLFRFIESLQTVQTGLATAFTSRLSARTLVILLRLIARPINFLSDVIGRLKSWQFPMSVDSFLPRTSGSRGMLMGGRAATAAAVKLRDSAFAIAAKEFGTDASKLAIVRGGVCDPAQPDRVLTWREIATRAGGQLQTLAGATLPPGYLLSPKTGNQLGCIDRMFGTHACDVAVNPATGEVRILRIVVCHDVGKVINPQIVRGQTIGAVVMGIGQTLWESIPREAGRVTIHGLHEYHIATSLDAPGEIEIHMIESGAGFGPGGAKGVGEGGMVAAPAAVANAIYDALGVQIGSITCTPEEIARLASEQGADRLVERGHANA